MAKPLEYNATLVEREDLTSALGVFRIRPDEALPGTGAWFVPGQYMVLGLNNEVKVELGGVRRPSRTTARRMSAMSGAVARPGAGGGSDAGR